MGHAQAMCILCFGLQQVLLRTDVAIQGHNDFFTNGVDWWIGDLRKALFEIVVEHAWLFRHHGQGRIVAHGAQRIAKLFNHREQHELHGFLRITKRLHARSQGDVVKRLAS